MKRNSHQCIFLRVKEIELWSEINGDVHYLAPLFPMTSDENNAESARAHWISASAEMTEVRI